MTGNANTVLAEEERIKLHDTIDHSRRNGDQYGLDNLMIEQSEIKYELKTRVEVDD